MTSALYSKAKTSFLTGAINMTADTIKVVAIDLADYTPNLTTHDFLDDVPSGARVGTATSLANKTVTGDGVFDADDVTLSGVTGDQFEALLMFKDTGTEATSPLIAIWDSATGLPFTPSGSDIIVNFDNGTNKIFKL